MFEKNTYNLAIIGFGGMGRWHWENVTEKVDLVKVIGIYDVQEAPCKIALENKLHVYASADELCDDPKVDIVLIATPNDFHKPLAIKCLEAGKNVICEKPVTLNAAELEEIIAVSQKTGKLFSVHQNRRWDKDFRIIKKLYDTDDIGKPYFIESRVQGSRGVLHGWRGYKVNGGGMILDWGVHLIDQLMFMIDSPVVSVDAHLVGLYCEAGVDDNVKIFLKFENGISGLIEVATNCLYTLPRWHVSAPDGTAVVDDWACNGRIVRLNTDNTLPWDDDIVYTEAGPTRTMAPRPEYTTQVDELPEVETDWSDYYNNYVAALNGEEELIVTPAQALRVMKVIDKIFEVYETGSGVACRI